MHHITLYCSAVRHFAMCYMYHYIAFNRIELHFDADRGITSYSLHPGLVRTDLGRELEGTVSSRCFRALWGCFRVRLLTPEEGARTSVYCCLEPSIVSRSGQYYR